MKFLQTCVRAAIVTSLLATGAHAEIQLPTAFTPLIDTASGLQWVKTYDTTSSASSGFRTATSQEFEVLLNHYGMGVNASGSSALATEYIATGKDIRQLGFAPDKEYRASSVGTHLAQGIGWLNNNGSAFLGGVDTYAKPIPCDSGSPDCWSGTDYTSRALVADAKFFDNKDLGTYYPGSTDPLWTSVYGFALLNTSVGTYMVRAVPEPSTLSLFTAAMALAGLATAKRRKA